MREHPAVTAAKIGLMAVIAFGLVFHFVAINQTQSKVIETAVRLDALKDQVSELERTLERGIPVTGSAQPVYTPNPATPAAAVAAATDEYAGWEDILGQEPDPPRPPDDEIDFDAQYRTQLPTEPKGMNIYTSDRDQYVATTIGYYVYAPLALRMDRNKDMFKPEMATRVRRSPDKKTYVIDIRPGVYWQRPPVDLTNPTYSWMRGRHEVTAHDLVFALDMLLDERADTDQMRESFADIESYEALTDHRLRVTWKEPNFYSTGVLLTDLKAFPRWIYEREEDGTPIDDASIAPRFAAHWFSKKMCGYGSYHFKEYKTSDYVLLERNENYWGRRPGFKSILYKLSVRDDEPRYNMFMKRNDDGRRDQAGYAVSPSRWATEVLQDPSSALNREIDTREAYAWQYPRKMYAYQGWRTSSVFFSDSRVRRAMTMAANRPLWRKEILHDLASFPTGIAYGPSPEYDRSIEPHPYDLEEAARLLDEAGWVDADGNGVREKVVDGEKVEFRFGVIQTPSSPALSAMRDDWQQSLQKIGVVMEPDVVEWNQLLKRVRDRDFDACALAWFLSDDFQPDTLFHSRTIDTPGSHNYVEWSNDRADEIFDTLKTEFDLERRYELCHEFHEIFHEEQPYTIMWSWRNPVMFDSRIGGMRARVFSPQVDYRHIWWNAEGPAEYPEEFSKPGSM